MARIGVSVHRWLPSDEPFRLRARLRWRKPAFVLAAIFLLAPPLRASYDGFGSLTLGGAGASVVEVTSLADSGPGTLREALKEGNRRILFRIGGPIRLRKGLSIRGKSFMTIDGSTAPAPGITLEGHGIDIRGSHDILVSHLRIRNSALDGITVKNGSYNIVIDHCSLANAADENLSITNDSRNVTVSWCILGDNRPDSFARHSKGMLVSHFDASPVTHISIHHNLFIHQAQRSPQISTAGLFDLRNNVIAHWKAYGARVRNGARGNIIANVFKAVMNPGRALIIAPDAGPVFVHNNRGPEGFSLDSFGTASGPLEVAGLATEPVETVEKNVLKSGGVFPRDATDTWLIGRLTAASPR